jgi:hypothetical protein
VQRVVRVDLVAPIHLDPKRGDGVLATPDPDTGFLHLEGRLTRTGVFTYQDAEGNSWGELRTEDEVFSDESLASFRQAVVTNNHPESFVDHHNVKQVQVGHVGTDVRQEGDFVRASILVTDASTILAIQQGKRELSCGYTAILRAESGDGYTYVQTNIRGNHVAIVDVGRAGPACALMNRGDGAAYTENTMAVKKADAAPAKKPDVKAGAQTVLDAVKAGAFKIELAKTDDAAQAEGIIALLQAALDTGDDNLIEAAISKAGEMIASGASDPAETAGAEEEPEMMGQGAVPPGPFDSAEAIKLRAQVDSFKATQAAQEKTFAARVDARVALVQSVREVCPSLDPTGKTDEALMRAVVLEVNPAIKPKLDANAKTPGYLRAAYDAALDLHAKRGEYADELAESVFDTALGREDDDDPDLAHEQYMDRLTKRSRQAPARKEA